MELIVYEFSVGNHNELCNSSQRVFQYGFNSLEFTIEEVDNCIGFVFKIT